MLTDLDSHAADRHVVIGVALLVAEAVLDLEQRGRIGLEHPPVAVVFPAFGAGHVVLHQSVLTQVVFVDRCGVARWSPPLLKLAWVGVQSPDAFDRVVEVHDEGQGQVVEVFLQAGDAHTSSICLGSRASRPVIRSTRPRQVASRSSRACRTHRSFSASAFTSRSLPLPPSLIRPALSSSSTFCWTEAKTMSYASAISDTYSFASPLWRRMSHWVALHRA